MIQHGFYMDMGRMAYPQHIQSYWRQQASKGLTTGVISANDTWHFDPDPAVGLCMMVEGMLDAGLAKMAQPLLVTSCLGRHAAMARELRTEEWPEIVLCGVEDPSAHHLPALKAQAAEAHEYGFRFSCCANAAAMLDQWEGERLGSAVDVWIVQGKTWKKDTSRHAQEMGKELWSYWCDDLTHVQGVLRWYAGLWAYCRQVKNCLVWAWSHHPGTHADERGAIHRDPEDRHTFAVPDANGNVIETEDYLGFQQGIRDCRVLEGVYDSALSGAIARLEALAGEVPHPMFRRLAGPPMLDMDQIAQELQAIMDE